MINDLLILIEKTYLRKNFEKKKRRRYDNQIKLNNHILKL